MCLQLMQLRSDKYCEFDLTESRSRTALLYTFEVAAETLGRATLQHNTLLYRLPNLIARMIVKRDALTPLRCLAATAWLSRIAHAALSLCHRPAILQRKSKQADQTRAGNP